MKQDFQIAQLMVQDAHSLSRLMISNTARFGRFFPNTLAQNLTAEKSYAYITVKVREIARKEEFTWAIRENKNNLIAGLIILKELDWNKRQGELAYCIGSEYEGKGWTTKVVQEISHFAQKELGLSTLQIIVHKSNTASIKVAEKSGYTWQRTLEKEYTPPKEGSLDMELYELSI